jgi:hypothetical protein
MNERSADEQRWAREQGRVGKRTLRPHKRGTGILKIGKTLGIGTGTVQRVATEQSRPFDVDVAEAAFASHVNGRSKAARVPGGVVRGG